MLIGVALAIADLLLTQYTAEHERSLARQRLERSLRFVASGLQANSPANLQIWSEQTDAALDSRVTVIDTGGVVLADSRHDPETMENHAARPEVREALAGRIGSSIRRSATLDLDFLYYAAAVDMPGRGRAVLRLAIPLAEVSASISAVRLLILQASGIAAAIALVFAYVMARRFTGRVRRIESYATELVKGDYSGTVAVEVDDELGSLARSLRTMAEHYRRILDLLAQESANREAILGSMVEGVAAVDHDLRITFHNDAFRRALHFPERQTSGVTMLQVTRDPALKELLTTVVASGTPARARLSLMNGEDRIFEVQAAPLRQQGKAGAIATFHDITELVRLERVRKDFVANISHELRTPLAAIHGFTETLLEGALEDPPNNRKFLEIIAAHTSRLNNLAFDLLTLTEIESERTPAPGNKLSTVELVESAIQMAAALAKERDVRISLTVREEAFIWGPKGRLERAVLNLLLNAINYNHPGGEVRIGAWSADGLAHISVADTGIGIASQDIPRIFERFYRVDKSRSRETGGTGLGLSIVKHVVERAGGSVKVNSQLGKGSVFTLEFPHA